MEFFSPISVILVYLHEGRKLLCNQEQKYTHTSLAQLGSVTKFNSSIAHNRMLYDIKERANNMVNWITIIQYNRSDPKAKSIFMFEHTKIYLLPTF